MFCTWTSSYWNKHVYMIYYFYRENKLEFSNVTYLKWKIMDKRKSKSQAIIYLLKPTAFLANTARGLHYIKRKMEIITLFTDWSNFWTTLALTSLSKETVILGSFSSLLVLISKNRQSWVHSLLKLTWCLPLLVHI